MAVIQRAKKQPDVGDFLRYGLIGGIISGALGGIPLINLPNVCCLWVLVGGFIAGFLMKRDKGQIEPVQGAIAGLIAGVVAVLVSSLLGAIFGAGFAMMGQVMGGSLSPVDMIAGLAGVVAGAILGALLSLLVWPIVGAIGGAIPALMK